MERNEGRERDSRVWNEEIYVTQRCFFVARNRIYIEQTEGRLPFTPVEGRNTSALSLGCVIYLQRGVYNEWYMLEIFHTCVILFDFGDHNRWIYLEIYMQYQSWNIYLKPLFVCMVAIVDSIPHSNMGNTKSSYSMTRPRRSKSEIKAKVLLLLI